LRPRFVDIDPVTFNTTPELADAALTERTRLILALQTFGFPLDVETLRDVALGGGSRTSRRRHTIHLIEMRARHWGGHSRAEGRKFWRGRDVRVLSE